MTTVSFSARGNFDAAPARWLDLPFTVNPDGTDLRLQRLYIGGHPEWESGHRIIGTDRQEVIGTLGDPTIFPSPAADIALSPDGRLFVNGFRQDGRAYYAILRRSDSTHLRTRGFDVRPWTSGDLRCDPAPCWNRDSTHNQILFPAIADDPGKTRQLSVIHLRGLSPTPS